MTGCWLDDRLLVDWERALLAAVQQPVVYSGSALYWNLDRVPRATLRALCWPRASGP
jgi:hypothetical protein